MQSAPLIRILLVAMAPSFAATLPYQGILTDDKGIPVADGPKEISFAVYGQSTGGSPLWTEPRVTSTRKGLFSVALGATLPLPDSLFARDSLFLGVTVSGSELSPRTSLGTSPWTFRARKADTAKYAQNVQGLGAKLDTATLTTRLAPYATKAELTYGLSAKLDSAALTTRLAPYATKAELTYGLAGKMTTTSFVDNLNRIKSVAGFIGGSGMPSQWQGSQILIDTTRVMVNTNERYATMKLNGITWQDAYSGWRLDRPNDDTIYLSSFTQTSSTKAFGASSGNVRFYKNVVVDGSLVASGVVLADYVFEPDYRLAPLSEVESFVKVNKHLPEIPSAEDVARNGMDIAKMNNLLLQKVEELTLHAIAQEKRIQALEERLK